jgi:hypothetical protein
MIIIAGMLAGLGWKARRCSCFPSSPLPLVALYSLGQLLISCSDYLGKYHWNNDMTPLDIVTTIIHEQRAKGAIESIFGTSSKRHGRPATMLAAATCSIDSLASVAAHPHDKQPAHQLFLICIVCMRRLFCRVYHRPW